MLSFYNIWTTAKFEIQTLSRSWFLRIFTGLTLLVLLFFNLAVFTDTISGFIPRDFYGITSSFPYADLILFNLAQAVITVFLASDFLKRDKKLDTTDAIYIRSIANSEYILGKVTALLVIFLFLNIVILLISALFNLIAPGSLFNITAYLLLPALISLPTLLFIIGFTFLLMTIIKNQAVVFILLLGYIAVVLFYLGFRYHRLFDYSGFYLPFMYSDFIGFGNLTELIIQRAIYFFLGLSFIFLSMYFFKRLPQSVISAKFSILFSALFFAIGVSAFIYRISELNAEIEYQNKILKLNSQYYNAPLADITDENISLVHKGSSVSVTAEAALKNNSAKTLNKLILRLNPGFNISSISADGKDIPFERKAHLIIINSGINLQLGQTLNLKLIYSGKPADYAMYPDIPKDKKESLYSAVIYKIHKMYSIVTGNYLLLTPEAMWYPQSGAGYSIKNQFKNNINFINFNLKVKTKENLLAVSQGKVKSSDGEFTFVPETPLPQISLAIGEYKKESISVDSTEYSLITLKNHSYYKKYFTEISDTLGALIRTLRQDYERKTNLEYPFGQFSIVEVPIQFTSYKRIYGSQMESCQPEIVFLPENGLTLADADFRQRETMQKRFGNRSNQVILPRENQSNNFNRFAGGVLLDEPAPFRFFRGGNIADSFIKPYSVFPNFFDFTNVIYSDDYPIFNSALENYLNTASGADQMPFIRNIAGLYPSEKAIIVTKGKSLKQVISDTAYNAYIGDLLKLKGEFLFEMLNNSNDENKLKEKISGYLSENRFKKTSLADFAEIFPDTAEFFQLLKNWYTDGGLPGYYITKLDNYKIIDGGRERYQVKVHITNSENTAGVVKIKFDPRAGGRRGGFRMRFGGQREESILEETIIIPPKRTIAYSAALDEEPERISINSIISKNLPLESSFNFNSFEEKKKAKAESGITLLDKTDAFTDRDEIIIDNEDKGFRVHSPETTSWLKSILNFSSADTTEYSGVRFWNLSEQWKKTINADAYGKLIHSFHFIKSGDGGGTAEWTAEIPESGYYDVYTHIVDIRNFRRGRNNKSKKEFNYKVFSDDGEDDISVKQKSNDPEWYLLGGYYFSQGEAKVELNNKSNSNSVTADAVKFVRRK